MVFKVRTFRDFYPYFMSNNYKIRLLGEYCELCYRLIKLEKILESYKNKSLDFEPICSLSLLELQAKQMQGYKTILEKRAKIEDVALPEVEVCEEAIEEGAD